MRIFYLAASNAIFSEALHGPKLAVVAPTEEQVAAGEPPEIIDNPDCQIPPEAVELAPEQFAEVLEALGDGRDMQPGPDGLPAFTPRKLFYHPEIGGFFNEEIHGQQRIAVWNSELDRAIGVPPSWEANPDYAVPEGAIEISAERYAELLEAQSAGQVIIAGDDGLPIALDRVQDEAERQEVRRLQRASRLAASDWTQLPDALTDNPGRKRAWADYRQLLRDLDMTGTAWPLAPGEEAPAV